MAVNRAKEKQDRISIRFEKYLLDKAKQSKYYGTNFFKKIQLASKLYENRRNILSYSGFRNIDEAYWADLKKKYIEFGNYSKDPVYNKLFLIFNDEALEKSLDAKVRKTLKNLLFSVEEREMKKEAYDFFNERSLESLKIFFKLNPNFRFKQKR